MNHDDVERDLPWYVNGTLAAESLARVERELPGCAGCTDEIAEIRSLRNALRANDDAAGDAPQAFADDVFRRIGTSVPDAKAPGKVRAFPVRAVAGGAGLAAAAAVAIFVSAGHAGTNGSSLTGAVSQPVQMPASEERQSEDTYSLAPAGGLAAHGASAPVAKMQQRGPDALAARERKLARTGRIGLIVGDVSGTLKTIDGLALAESGTVTALDDESPSTPGETHAAHVTLSVPSDRFAASLDALAALGGVTSRTVKTEDVTDAMVDTEARLHNLRHEEADLVRIMDRQGKVGDILDVEQQLASTRESIEQLDAQDKSMAQRVSYSTIAVDLTDEKHAQVAVPGAATQVGDAWRHATRLLWSFTLALIAKALVLAAFAPYLIVLGVAAWFAYRSWLRRRAYRR